MAPPLDSPASPGERPTWFPIVIGLLAVFLPTVGRLALIPLVGAQAPYLLHLIAAVAATWIAGGRAGVIALAGGSIAVQFLFLEPRNRVVPASMTHAVGGVLFLAVAGAAVWLVDASRRADRALRQQRERLQRLVDAATESIWLLGRDGTVLLANAVATTAVGRTVADVIGKRWHALLPPDVAARRQQYFQEVYDTGRPLRFEDDRAGLHLDHHFCPTFDEAGRVSAVAVFSRDVTQQRRALEELRELSQRLTYHVTHSPLAVIEWGPDMRLTRWAGEAERVFGWAAEEVLGKSLEDFRWVYDEDADQVHNVSTALRTGADLQRFSLNRNYRKDGSVVWCEWYNSSLLDESGRFKSILSLVLDVTERRTLEEQLRATAAELSRANLLKDEFLATLSHELRTPLHAIVGWSHMLRSGKVPPERYHHAFEVIERNARAQSQLVEDVLDMSRVVTGKVQLSLELVKVRPVIATALESIRPAADVKGVTIDSDVEDVTLVADAARLQQIVWNLLSNAVKFTPAGGRVTVTAARARDHVDLVVEDTGIGIAPEFLPRVFERFAQADASATRRHGGLGLGLAIVRHLAEMLGGTVSASSPGKDRGATFTVSIPTREAVAPFSKKPVDTAPHLDPALLAGLRVLVIDDEDDTREVVGETLTAAGAAVTLAADGAQAVAAASAARFDVIVSDIAMPGEDGHALLEHLRLALEPAPVPPAIALTGYGFPVDRRRALEAGFREHLAKPVSPEVLVDCVRCAADAARLASPGGEDAR